MTEESAAKCPNVPASAGCSNSGNLTSGLYNEQIAPLRGMVFKLAVWYQVSLACGVQACVYVC